MIQPLISKVKNSEAIKYIFCDYCDTVIHRKVHPLKPFNIWSKLMIKELGLSVSIQDLFEIRRNSMRSLSEKKEKAETELLYSEIMREVYDSLVTRDKKNEVVSFLDFLKYANEADYEAEASVQYLNKKTVATLRYLKNEGYTIYCVSDFHSETHLLERLIKFHGINDLYDKVFVSATQQASKENGGLLFKQILEQDGIAPNTVLMVGDNPISDVANAELNGMESYYLKRYLQKLKQKIQYGFFVLEKNF